MIAVKNSASESAKPVAAPVAASLVVAQALAEAAQAHLAAFNALQKAANALTGELSALPKINRIPISGSLGSLGTLSDLSVNKLINLFLQRTLDAGNSDRYVRTLRSALCIFSEGRAKRPFDSVTVQEVEKWVYGLGVRPKTMKGYLNAVRSMFHFAARRNYVTQAWAEGFKVIELPKSDTRHKAPAIHTPAESQKFLNFLRSENLDVMRHMAIRYFCGVRSAEAHRMTEANILTDRGYIEVPALAAKSRARRLVKLRPSLEAWLALGGTLRGICPETIRKLARRAGVPWGENYTRHSFVTYHYEMWEDENKTAKEAGNSPAMLFGHYRAVVTKEQAEQFWAIVPENFAPI